MTAFPKTLLLAALADRFAVIVPDADALDRADRASIELNAGVRSCG